MSNDSPLKLSPISGESFELSPKIGESLRLSPNPWLSPNLGDPLLNVVLSKWPTLLNLCHQISGMCNLLKWPQLLSHCFALKPFLSYEKWINLFRNLH